MPLTCVVRPGRTTADVVRQRLISYLRSVVLVRPLSAAVTSMLVPTTIAISEAAQRLGVHENTIRNWIDHGVLDGYRLPNGHRKLRLDSVERLAREMFGVPSAVVELDDPAPAPAPPVEVGGRGPAPVALRRPGRCVPWRRCSSQIPAPNTLTVRSNTQHTATSTPRCRAPGPPDPRAMVRRSIASAMPRRSQSATTYSRRTSSGTADRTATGLTRCGKKTSVDVPRLTRRRPRPARQAGPCFAWDSHEPPPVGGADGPDALDG